MPPKDVSSPAKPAAATGGRGSMGGGLNASAVDTDKLWRDRIRQELQFQRQWKEEFGFLQSTTSSNSRSANNNNNETSGDGDGDDNHHSNNGTTPTKSRDVVSSLLHSTKNEPVGSAAATVNINDISPADLAALQKKLQNAQYTSTAQASYKYDRSRLLELGAGSHRKQKFRV